MTEFDLELEQLKGIDESEWRKARAASLLATRAYHRQLKVMLLEKLLLAALVSVGLLYTNNHFELVKSRSTKERERIEKATRAVLASWHKTNMFCVTGEDSAKEGMFAALLDAEIEVMLAKEVAPPLIEEKLSVMHRHASKFLVACGENNEEKQEQLNASFCKEKMIFVALMAKQAAGEELPADPNWDWRTLVSEDDVSSRCGG